MCAVVDCWCGGLVCAVADCWCGGVVWWTAGVVMCWWWICGGQFDVFMQTCGEHYVDNWILCGQLVDMHDTTYCGHGDIATYCWHACATSGWQHLLL